MNKENIVTWILKNYKKVNCKNCKKLKDSYCYIKLLTKYDKKFFCSYFEMNDKKSLTKKE